MAASRFARLCFFAFAVIPLAARGQGTYTQIDYPGAVVTSCLGIDEAGDITGEYEDAQYHWHGFLYSRGAFTTIDYPGAQASALYRMNDVGQIVGVADNAGFLYNLNTETFSSINFPGATSTVPTSINNAGVVAGYFTLLGNDSPGFELVGSVYRSLPPQKNAGGTVWGITSRGAVVGHSKCFDFWFSKKYQQIVIPNVNCGQIFGTDKTGTAFVGHDNANGGFLIQNGTEQPLQFPGGGLTYGYGVNSSGEVVGVFLDSTDNQHGFSWVPDSNMLRDRQDISIRILEPRHLISGGRRPYP